MISAELRLHQESLPLLDVPETWHATTGVDPDQARGVILLADPFRMDAHLLVRGMSRCYPNTPIVGGMTSGANHDDVLGPFWTSRSMTKAVSRWC